MIDIAHNTVVPKDPVHIIPFWPRPVPHFVPKARSDASPLIFAPRFTKHLLNSAHANKFESFSRDVFAYNLFKLFFRASIFFLSRGALEAIGPSFFRAAAATTAGSETVGF